LNDHSYYVSNVLFDSSMGCTTQHCHHSRFEGGIILKHEAVLQRKIRAYKSPKSPRSHISVLHFVSLLFYSTEHCRTTDPSYLHSISFLMARPEPTEDRPRVLLPSTPSTSWRRHARSSSLISDDELVDSLDDGAISELARRSSGASAPPTLSEDETRSRDYKQVTWQWEEWPTERHISRARPITLDTGKDGTPSSPLSDFEFAIRVGNANLRKIRPGDHKAKPTRWLW
jgi:hypothetical protein